MVDEKALADARAGVNLDARHMAAVLGNPACQRRVAVLIEPMRQTVIGPSPSPTDSTAAPPIWISPPGRVPSPTRYPREDCQTFHPPFRINAKSPAVSIQRRQGRGSTLFKRVKKRLARFVLTRRPCQSLSARLSLEAPGCTSPCSVPDALAAGGASSLPVFAKVLFRSLPFSPIICNRRGEVKLFRAAKHLKTDRRQFSCVSPFADA